MQTQGLSNYAWGFNKSQKACSSWFQGTLEVPVGLATPACFRSVKASTGLFHVSVGLVRLTKVTVKLVIVKLLFEESVPGIIHV